jgi:F-type H+-transporting ATPase subunit b
MTILAAFFYLFEGGSLLSPDFSLVIALIFFVAFIFVLNALILKPVTKVLDERERLTSGAIDEAKKASHDYEKQLSSYEEKIRAARAESYKLLETQRKQALDERGKKLAQVKQQVADQIEINKKEIDAASATARGRLESDAQAMAESISRNLLKRPLGGTTS